MQGSKCGEIAAFLKKLLRCETQFQIVSYPDKLTRVKMLRVCVRLLKIFGVKTGKMLGKKWIIQFFSDKSEMEPELVYFQFVILRCCLRFSVPL